MKKLTKKQLKAIQDYKERELKGQVKTNILPMGITGQTLTGVKRWG